MTNETPESLAFFTPLRRATHARLIALFIVGPILWLAALVLIDLTVRNGRDIGVALVVCGVSFAVALVWLIPMRMQRVRQEAEPP
jgi:hypothetical protein